MKRRDFLLTASGVLGTAVISRVASAQARPCPPILGGAQASSCGPVPDWFGNLQHLEWTAPVTNWLGADGVKDPLADSTNARNSGHQSIIYAWNGMLADDTRRTIAMLANGGHNDYAGNEVYSCDLSEESPRWIRRRDATPSESGSSTYFQWSDGTPGPTHTNNAQIAANGRWFLLGMTASCYDGDSDESRCWEYDPDKNLWINLGSVGPGSTSFGTCAMYYPGGPDGGLLIRASQDYTAYQSLDNPGSLYEQGGGTPSNGDALMGAVDTTHGVMLTWQALGTNNYRWRKLTSGSARTGSSNVLAAKGTPPSFKTAQIHWHAPSKAFLTWAGSGSQNLKKLTPIVDGSGNYVALEWSDVAGFGAVTPTWGPNELMYNKINVITDMGNGDMAFIVVPRYGNPDTFVMRISGPV